MNHESHGILTINDDNGDTASISSDYFDDSGIEKHGWADLIATGLFI